MWDKETGVFCRECYFWILDNWDNPMIRFLYDSELHKGLKPQ